MQIKVEVMEMSVMVSMAIVVMIMMAVGVKGQSGPVTTESTVVGLGDDYFYDDTKTSSNNAQTPNPTSEGVNPNTPLVSSPSSPGSPSESGGAPAGGGKNKESAGRHAGGGLFFPLYGGAINRNPNFPGPGPISQDYWDNSQNVRMGQPFPPHMGKAGIGAFPWIKPGQAGVQMPVPPWHPMQGQGRVAAGPWWGGEDDGVGWGMLGANGVRAGGVPMMNPGGGWMGGGVPGGFGVGLAGGMGRGYPYGEFEGDEGYWYNGTYYYGGGEMEGEGGGYWYNGTYYYSPYGEDGMEMEDGYWYNGTFYYGNEMDEGMFENEYYEDGYWYNGTFYYLPEFDDGYWYNGTFHYMPEADDGYWFNGTFHYLPEYDEGYWYNGTFYYRPEMDMEMGEGMGDMMENGFYYNGTFYPGEMKDGGFGYGGYGDDGMEMDEGMNNMMWWQLHHPRWRDRTNDALKPPGIDIGKMGTGVGWNYIPGLKPGAIPGPMQTPYGPNFARFPNMPYGQMPPPFRGYPPFQQQQLPRPPSSPQQNTGSQQTDQSKTDQGIQITQPVFEKLQQKKQQQQQAVPPPNRPPNQNGNPFLRLRQPRPPPSQNRDYIERNPMRSAMTGKGNARNTNTDNVRNNNNNKDKNTLLGALGMGGMSASAAAGAGGSGAHGTRILNSRRRWPPRRRMKGNSRRRGGPPGYRRGPPGGSRRGRILRERLRRPGKPIPGNSGDPFGVKISGSNIGIGNGNVPGTGRGVSGGGPMNFNDKIKPGSMAMSAGGLTGGTNRKLAMGNQHPSNVIRKEASSPLDPYRSSPASTLGILFASLLGFLLIVSPMACLIHKYRQNKKTKKKTFLRRPELGSVDEGIMDAMVRTELGGAYGCDEGRGGARSSGEKSKGRGLERTDLVRMEEVVRSKSGKSRFGGSVGCWGDKGDQKKKGTDKKRGGGQIVKGKPEVGMGLMSSYDDDCETAGPSSSSFTRRHEEMGRAVRGLDSYDEEERRKRRMRLREQHHARGGRDEDRQAGRRPYTVVGLMSENDDVQIV